MWIYVDETLFNIAGVGKLDLRCLGFEPQKKEKEKKLTSYVDKPIYL